MLLVVVNEVPLTIVHRDPPVYIHGQRLANMFHRGDVAKMEVLRQYGGIYLDYDVIVVNSLDPVRRYDMTLGADQGRSDGGISAYHHHHHHHIRLIYTPSNQSTLNFLCGCLSP